MPKVTPPGRIIKNRIAVEEAMEAGMAQTKRLAEETATKTARLRALREARDDALKPEARE